MSKPSNDHRFNFTKDRIEGVALPLKGQRITRYDESVPKLAIRVTSTGTRTFYVIKRTLTEGVVFHKLGIYPEMTIEQARKLAAVALAEFARGDNPAKTRRIRRDEMTVEDLHKEYLAEVTAKRKRPDMIEGVWKRYLRHWGNRKLSALTHQEIARWHRTMPAKIQEARAELRKQIEAGEPMKRGINGREVSGTRTANMALKQLRTMFAFAANKRIYNDDPTRGIELFKEKSRDRFLGAGELPRFFASLAEEDNDIMRHAFLLAILTGARRSNILEMRWSEIDLDAGLWRIPDTKNGTPQTVTLTTEAIETLRSRKEKAENKAVFVFPGNGTTGHAVEPKGAWRRIFDRDELAELAKRINASGAAFSWPIENIKLATHKGRNLETLAQALERARRTADELNIDRAGARLDDLRIHDLRRTLGSWQAKTGASLVIIGKSLNHKSHQSTAVYARLDLDPVRDSMQTATSALLAAAQAGNSAEVIPLRPKAA